MLMAPNDGYPTDVASGRSIGHRYEAYTHNGPAQIGVAAHCCAGTDIVLRKDAGRERADKRRDTHDGRHH